MKMLPWGTAQLPLEEDVLNLSLTAEDSGTTTVRPTMARCLASEVVPLNITGIARVVELSWSAVSSQHPGKSFADPTMSLVGMLPKMRLCR